MARKKKNNKVKEEVKETKVKEEEEEITVEKKEEIRKATNKARWDMFTENLPFLILIAFILIIRIFIASPVRVQQTSMTPTLKEGDILLLYKLKLKTKGISRFDVVVIKSDSGTIIKRVIGMPGETIKYDVYEENGIVKNALYVDGKKIEEDFVSDEYKNGTCHRNFKLCTEGVKLGEDEYFVMGDTRPGSYDSRDIGPIKKKHIKGITEIRLLPFKSFGKFDKKAE